MSAKWIKIIGISLFLLAAVIFIAANKFYQLPKYVAGGGIHNIDYDEIVNVFNENVEYTKDESEVWSERFQRPSKDLPLHNKYSFKDFENDKSMNKKFENPEDVIYAYYGILREASNMVDYTGGCGTIGYAKEPYPYAYELLANPKTITLNEFIDSFKGIGYITFLKLYPAYNNPDTEENLKNYMVEIETITGRKWNESSQKNECLFEYYYGIAQVENQGGWRIKKIDCYAEDFLCAPMHSWFYLSDAVVEIVYKENLKIVDKINKTEKHGNVIDIYASGNAEKYKFEFIRITNGYDILLHEYIYKDGKWVETSLLTKDWGYLKLTFE